MQVEKEKQSLLIDECSNKVKSCLILELVELNEIIFFVIVLGIVLE